MPNSTDPITFDALYFASKDPRIVALQQLNITVGVAPDTFSIADVDARTAAALALNALGLIIDRQIDIWGWSPYFVMVLRESDGYVWCANAFQQNAASLLDYQDPTKAWPGSIKVSLDPADYPQFGGTPVPAAPPSAVGGATGLPGVFAVNPAGFYKNGSPLYVEGEPALAPDGEIVYAHYGPSGIMWGWSFESMAAREARIAQGN